MSAHFPRLTQFSRHIGAVAVGFVLFAAPACRRPTGQNIVLTKDQEHQIAENVLAAPPATLTNKTEVKFEDKIALLGWEQKGTPKKGEAFDLTMYFRVDQPLHGDWKVFVHLEAPGKRRQPFDHYGIGGLYPLGNWKKGEIVRDTVNIQVPPDWPDGTSQILVGFFDWGAWSKASQDRRLKPTSGGGDKITGDDRYIVTTIDLGGAGQAGGEAQAPTPRSVQAPTIQVLTAKEVPTVDGKLDEALWQAVTAFDEFRQPDGQSGNRALHTTARFAWGQDGLLVGLTTRDDDLRNPHTQDDATLWEGDVLELFVAVPGKPGEYVELQWSPTGHQFDAKFTAHRTPEWPEAAKFNAGVRHAVSVDGNANADGTDRGYTVEALVPWKGLGLESAPAAGTQIAANVYRIDDKGAHDLGHMLAMAPVGGDFHKLEGAATLVLSADEAQAPAAGQPTGEVPAVRVAPAAK
jgi:hypothetical protein